MAAYFIVDLEITDDALNNVPSEDWHAEISRWQKESDGRTLIWLEGRSDPSYSIQE